MKDIGGRIREQRKKNGITQEAMANALGVTAQAVSKWENGQNAPDISMIIPICGFLGIGADELLGGTQKRDANERYWENLNFGDEFALVVINEALKELPIDRVWLERKFFAELGVAETAKTEQYKNICLENAEKALDTLIYRYPERSDEYKYYQTQLCIQKGLKEEAVKTAWSIEKIDMSRRATILDCCLEGDELIKHKQGQLAHSFGSFNSDLLNYNTHESIDLAEELHNRLIGRDTTHNNKRALLYLSEGNTEKFQECAALSYDMAKELDEAPVLKYPSPMTDQLKRGVPLVKKVDRFIKEFAQTPLPHELKCRIVDDNLKYKPLIGYDVNTFLMFLLRKGNKDPEHYIDFSANFDATQEDWDEINRMISRRMKEGNFMHAEHIMMLMDMSRKLLKEHRLNGFILELGEGFPTGFCNCGDRDKYTYLGIRHDPESICEGHIEYTLEQLASVPEGARVFSIVDMAVHSDFYWCGIEKALIENACNWAIRAKYDYVEAYIDTDLLYMFKPDEVQRWITEYKNAGFEIVKDLSAGKYTKLVLQKKL